MKGGRQPVIRRRRFGGIVYHADDVGSTTGLMTWDPLPTDIVGTHSEEER
jgi:hypothetical protein